MTATPRNAGRPGGMAIAFLPLDERPVNTSLPSAVAAIAGAGLMLPPADLLPQLREPGKADDLGAWFRQATATADAAVASLDMLCYGGLIAARTSGDTTLTALERLETLRAIRKNHPDLPIAAVSLVMRASDSYNPQEEPDYWAQYGRELHRLGTLHHRDLLVNLGALDTPGNADELATLRAKLPAAILADFERRRLRNHHVNLEALALAADGTVDPLMITADDTAEHSGGSVEQIWLDQWARVLPISAEVLMYPGADEVAAVLVARQLATQMDARARFTVETADPEGLARIANYENSPMRVAIERQVKASGAELTEDAEAMALVIHTSDPRRRDLCGQVPTFDTDDEKDAQATLDLIARLIEQGREVALADLRYSNGADPILVEGLAERGLLLKLLAYGGWNTAGNALGSVVAAAAAIQIGRAAGTYDAGEARRLLLHRVIEDYAYQAVARRPLNAGILTFQTPNEERAAEASVGAELNAILGRLTGRSDLKVSNINFPWHRSFEIDFVIEGDLVR